MLETAQRPSTARTGIDHTRPSGTKCCQGKKNKITNQNDSNLCNQPGQKEVASTLESSPLAKLIGSCLRRLSSKKPKNPGVAKDAVQ